MYSSQGLKARKLKSKLKWLLVRNVVDHESVVQKKSWNAAATPTDVGTKMMTLAPHLFSSS